MAKKKSRRTDKVSDRGTFDISANVERSNLASKADSSPSNQSKFSWKFFGILLGVISLAVIACYANTLSMSVVFNDNVTFAQLKINDASAFWGKTWTQFFSQPLMQPWLRSSFALDYQNYANTFGWYHLVNVFLHLSACLALFCLVLRLSWRLRNQEQSSVDPWKVATASALLYACHPLAVQSATYISGRYAALAGANFLLALNAFLLGLFGRSLAPRLWGYGLAFFFGLMCLTSNEVGLALPAVMLSLFFVIKPAKTAWLDWAIEHPIVCGLLFILSVVLPFSYFLGFGPGYAADFYGFPMLDRVAYVATQAKAFLTYYTRCFIIPLGLSLDPPFSKAKGFADFVAVFGVLLFAGCAYGIYHFRRNKMLVLGLVLMVAGYIPHACIIQQESVADPIFYLSLAGASIIAGWVCTEVFGGSHMDAIKKFAPIILGLAVLTIFRTMDWSADDKLYAATLRTNENSAAALTWSSLNSLAKRDFQKGSSFADQALMIDPDLALAQLAKGQALAGLNDYVEADAHFRKGEKLATSQHLQIRAAARLALAESDIRMNKPDDVIRLVYQVAADDPNNPRLLYLIGMANFERKQFDQAAPYLQRGAQLGVMESLAPLTQCLIRMKHYDDALSVAQNAVQMLPGDLNSLFSLGCAQYAKKNFIQAEDSFKKVLKQENNDARAMAFLSLIYEHKGDATLAQSYRADAIKVNKNVFAELSLPVDDDAHSEADQKATESSKTAADTRASHHQNSMSHTSESRKSTAGHQRRRHG